MVDLSKAIKKKLKIPGAKNPALTLPKEAAEEELRAGSNMMRKKPRRNLQVGEQEKHSQQSKRSRST
jgi:hypothetical protein